MKMTMKSNPQKSTDSLDAGAQPTFAHACIASCRKLLARIESTKAGILAEFRESLKEHGHLLDLALNEAEALAWQTEFPQLLFPALATEKAQAVATWHARQQFLRQRGSPLAVAGYPFSVLSASRRQKKPLKTCGLGIRRAVLPQHALCQRDAGSTLSAYVAS
jgi:hypothetical protein